MEVISIKEVSQSLETSLEVEAFYKVVGVKMLAAGLLLSFFIGVVVCEDDETMALVSTGF